MNRREFIYGSLGIVGGSMLLNSCAGSKKKPIALAFHDDNGKYGHMIREQKFPEPSSVIHTKVHIAGAGVSGLTAAYFLSVHNHSDYYISELNDVPGGNAIAGKNEVSAFPWAAHYLPIPDVENKDMLRFLEDAGIVTGFNENKLPVYEEEYICHEPAERLYLNHKWQEGLVPAYAIEEKDKRDIARFFELIHKYREQKGSDGKYVFAIPLASGSKDPIDELDNISMQEFLDRNNFSSEYLSWYLDYCCRDDYGSDSKNTSAFAGIHYFASRRGVSANAEMNAVLTWPEGNNFLVKKLLDKISNAPNVNLLLYKVEQNDKEVVSFVYDVTKKQSVRIISEKLIYALPAHTIKYVLKDADFDFSSAVKHYPWVVANIKLSAFTQADRGIPISWDNVIYSRNSLGYVNACHQLVKQKQAAYNITYYQTIGGASPKEARKKARELTKEQIQSDVIAELKKAHPLIENDIESITCKVWGHAMVNPYPGFLSNVKPGMPVSKGSIHFAHSDLSGISIFEEAFYQGKRAAENVLKQLDVNATEATLDI